MAKRRKIDQLTNTAYHEAAHAVIAHELRIGFKRATIAPDSERGFLGCVTMHGIPKSLYDRIDTDLNLRDKDHLERRILVGLAGWVATNRLHGKHIEWRKAGADGDVRSAVNIINKLSGSNEEMNAYLDLLVVRARMMIYRQGMWAYISAVASELLKHTTLSARRIRQIIRLTRDELILKLRKTAK